MYNIQTGKSIYNKIFLPVVIYNTIPRIAFLNVERRNNGRNNKKINFIMHDGNVNA